MRLSHNLASLNIYNQLQKNEKLQSKAMGRISSGEKVSKASEGPYILGQSEAQRMQIRGLQMAQRNVQDGVSMLQSVGDALGSATETLQRIRELTVQAGGTSSADEKATIQNEIEQMKKGIDDIMNNTEFNGVKLLNNADVTSNSKPLSLETVGGANAYETVKIPKYNLTSEKLGDESTGKYLNSVDVTSSNNVSDTLGIIDSALNTISDIRTNYGALENRFSSMYDNIGETSDSLQAVESRIRDADVADEMVDYSRTGILIDAGNALMVQTNRFPTDVLKILENVRR